MNILLIEPDFVLSQIYSKFLKSRGHKVDITDSAGSSIEILEETSVDIIIIELQIAKHNGIELLHEIRSYTEWQNIPVIVNSFIPTEIIGINDKLFREFNIVGYLYKPITSLDNLLDSIESLQTVNT